MRYENERRVWFSVWYEKRNLDDYKSYSSKESWAEKMIIRHLYASWLLWEGKNRQRWKSIQTNEH